MWAGEGHMVFWDSGQNENDVTEWDEHNFILWFSGSQQKEKKRGKKFFLFHFLLIC